MSALLLSLVWPVPATRGQSTYFDDTDAEVCVLGNAIYEIVLQKQNGSLLSVTDKTAGANLTLGSLENSLWQVVFQDKTTFGGNGFSSAGPDTFAYAWESSTATLRLDYTPPQQASGKVTAEVVIQLSDASYFDLQLSVENHSGKVVTKVKFPQRWKLNRNQIDEALLPDRRGTVLESGFFTSILPSMAEYLVPHPPSVADYLAVQVQSGNLALYSVWTPGPIRQTVLGFEDHPADTVLLVHDFDMWEASGATWTSPPVRVRISQEFNETVLAYRADNQLDSFAGVQQKLGDKYDTVLQSPLLHLDPMWLDMNFDEWPDLFKRLPSPAIIMLSNYYSGGFHGHHPDYVPPDPEYGTTEELRAAVDAAHDLGMLVMPMTLPIWWHENSPTIHNLSVPLTDVARLDSTGAPDYFAWQLAGQVDWGYFVSPRAPYVQQRLAQYMDEMTQTLGYDLIYEDVLGASRTDPDFNANATKIFDTEGWLDHTRTYSDRLLLTENGYDHLAETEVAFLGGGWTPDWQSVDVPYSRIYPMAKLLLHDKVLFYHYWAYPNTTPGALSWNLTFGHMLNFPLQIIPAGNYKTVGDPWQFVNEEFQKYVVSRYADERMTDFTELSGGNVIRCDYESITVVANRNAAEAYASGEYGLPPEGVLVTSTSGDLIAGSFSIYNNVSLNAGEHYIIEQRGQEDIIIRQPLGDDTPLTLDFLPGWSATDPIWVLAYNNEDQLVDVTAPTVNSSSLTFTYRQNLQGQHMAFYKVVNTATPPQPDWNAFFNDYDLEVMLLGNREYYELSLGKQNGALNYILDKTSGDTLCRGVQWWRLWLANFPEAPQPDVGPATMIDYWPGGPNDFQHSWDQDNRVLTLNYVPDSTIYTERLGATITFTVSDEAYLDVQISFRNNWGYTMQSVSFPNNLIFDVRQNDEALLPISYPGVRLKSGFFDEGRSVEGEYPGRFHADYLALQIETRVMALYGLHHNQPVRMTRTGFVGEDNSVQGSNVFVVRKYPVWVEDGDTWESPILRIRFGADFEETLQAYRADNKLNLFTSLENKLGDNYQTVLRSPNFHVEFGESVAQPFSQIAALLEQMPSPALVMLSGYNSGGLHGFHPDYLPPDPQWGTTADLVKMVTDIKNQGKLVMPFTFPAWWHENSPTVQNLTSPGLTDIAQIGPDGQPVHFDMEGNPGTFISPNHQFVKDRLAQMVSEMKQDIGADLIYQGGIGALASDYDLNPAAPSALDYNEGWLEHTRTHESALLVVEEGYDGMSETAVGFMGTLYQDPETGESPWDFDFGENNWEAYPTAPVLYHDKVLIYPTGSNSTLSKHALSWSLAFGCMLSFEPSESDPELDPSSPWMKVIADFQRHVISRIAGKRMTGYDELAPGISESTFENITIVNNWNETGYSFGPHVVTPAGAVATSADGVLTGGVFSAFNGSELNAGDHFLVVQTFEDSILVRHPSGADTPININRPPGWEQAAGIKVTATTETGSHQIAQTVGDDLIAFGMTRLLQGEAIEYFRLSYDKTTGVAPAAGTLPLRYGLSQNHPNPFNPATKIDYQIPGHIASVHVSLSIYNVLGGEVVRIVDEARGPGHYSVTWDGRDRAGRQVASGLYFYRIDAGRFVKTRKLLLMK